MTEQAFALLLASTFTLGCVVIQALKRHTQAVTGILSIVALCLGSFVGLVSLVQKAEPNLPAEHPAIAKSNR